MLNPIGSLGLFRFGAAASRFAGYVLEVDPSFLLRLLSYFGNNPKIKRPVITPTAAPKHNSMMVWIFASHRLCATNAANIKAMPVAKAFSVRNMAEVASRNANAE